MLRYVMSYVMLGCFTWTNQRSVSDNEHARLALISFVETLVYL